MPATNVLQPSFVPNFPPLAGMLKSGKRPWLMSSWIGSSMIPIPSKFMITVQTVNHGGGHLLIMEGVYPFAANLHVSVKRVLPGLKKQLGKIEVIYTCIHKSHHIPLLPDNNLLTFYPCPHPQYLPERVCLLNQ